jgi:glutathione S-transferase
MILVGMLDSPYVRRCAISMKLMGVPFEHKALSVFRSFEEFRAINPVVKAPTLVCDDGAVLMDSTLILDHIESTVDPARRLMPTTVGRRREALRLIGLALAVTEKCVQMVYEHHQRPKAKMHEPWLERIRLQANAGLQELEKSVNAAPGPWLQGERLCASDLAVACLWRFSQFYLAETRIEAARYPALVGFSARAEALPEFASTPLD